MQFFVSLRVGGFVLVKWLRKDSLALKTVFMLYCLPNLFIFSDTPLIYGMLRVVICVLSLFCGLLFILCFTILSISLVGCPFLFGSFFVLLISVCGDESVLRVVIALSTRLLTTPSFVLSEWLER